MQKINSLCSIFVFTALMLLLEGLSISPTQQKLGISFSPAGLLTPYHLGASYELRRMGLLTSSTAVSGASGGALAAVTSALKISHTDGLAACEYIAERCAAEGTRYTLKVALNQVLEDILPSASAQMLNERDAKCFLAYKELFPTQTAHLITEFASKADLIEVLLASCNIPFYFNGNWPCVKVRGGAGVDGFFAVKRNRFGCPPTLAERELIICPFLPDTVGLNPEQEQEETDTLKGGIDASENMPYSSSTKATESNFHSDTAGTQTLRTKKFDILSPALLSPSDWPFSVSDLMQLALGPPKIRYPLDASSALLVPPQRNDLSGTIATSFSGNTKNSIGVSGMKKQSEGGIMSSREAYSLLFQSGVETVKAWARTVDITEYASLTQTVDTL